MNRSSFESNDSIPDRKKIAIFLRSLVIIVQSSWPEKGRIQSLAVALRMTFKEVARGERMFKFLGSLPIVVLELQLNIS